ncbi:hypothetical protein CSOJ01_11794 [Colletotrichum sojae]|uniref:Uncharacterized protein n=1 Tax=Colletotrichum sojae TaxID=2175907 RepID=A0A8H6IWE4_9PEZI|nr:hypothetical protein CSOJ01_11794 [Colletotrichum sojae]
MQISAFLTLLVASYAAATPIEAQNAAGAKDPSDIAACETKAAADQVACIDACKKDAACITGW